MTASAGSLKAREWIECALNEVVKEVAKGTDGKPCIELKRIEGYEARVDKHLASTQFMTKDHKVTYCWPGKTADEAWRFSCVVSVLNAMHAAICANVTVTKRFGLFTAPSGGGTNMWARDIFYGEPELFGDQVIVDSLIDDIVHTCQVRREDLHVTASPKGLFVSPCANRGEVQSIASDSVFKTSPAWILVMEKEATFNSLHQSNFHHCHQAGPGLLVTGKGYPDIATRHFLRWCIGSTDHAPQIFGLFDFDAYGVDILKTYRIGSKASATELHRNLPEIKWLGIKSEDIIQLPSSAALMPLTQKDRRKAIKLIESAVLEQGGTVEELLDCREELQRMLMLNKKAEIQVLEDQLCRWAERKMLEAMRDST